MGFMDTVKTMFPVMFKNQRIWKVKLILMESIKELLKLMKTPTGLSEKTKLAVEDVKRPYFVQC